MQVSKTGHHYPKKAWADWRDAAVIHARYQAGGKTFTTPVSMTAYFWLADRRRRDLTGLEDSIFHLLERAGILKDDSLIVEQHTYKVYAPDKPGATIEIKVIA